MKAIILCFFLILSQHSYGQVGKSWAWDAGKISNNGNVQLRSSDGSSSYSAIQNPTGSAVKVNQSSIIQPPTVIITNSNTSGGGVTNIPCFMGIDAAQIPNYCKPYSPVMASLFSTTVVGIYIGSLGGTTKNVIVATKDNTPRAWGCYARAWAGTQSDSYDGAIFSRNISYMMTDTANKPCWPSLNSDHSISWSAPQSCYDQTNYGFLGNWWLPTQKQMEMIYAQKNAIGGFFSEQYWTSNELLVSTTDGVALNMGTGVKEVVKKNISLRYRCAREMP